jgi:hypothetical protein
MIANLLTPSLLTRIMHTNTTIATTEAQEQPLPRKAEGDEYSSSLDEMMHRKHNNCNCKR